MWLSDFKIWFLDFMIIVMIDFNVDFKVIKELFVLVVGIEDDLDKFFVKIIYWWILRVCVWIKRFIKNVRSLKKD